MKKAITAHQALMYAFACCDFGNDPAAYPMEMPLVNWEKALTLELKKRDLTSQEEITLMHQVGYKEARVLQLVDPALRPIISRLLALEALTAGTCSGHPDELEKYGRTWMYFQVSFSDMRMAKHLMNAFRKAFPSPYTFLMRPWKFRAVAHTWLELPLEYCIQHSLPVSYKFSTCSIVGLKRIYKKVSRVLDQFDGKGTYVPVEADLEQHCWPDPELLFRGVVQEQLDLAQKLGYCGPC